MCGLEIALKCVRYIMMEELEDLVDRLMDSIVLDEPTTIQFYLIIIVHRLRVVDQKKAKRIIKNTMIGEDMKKMRMFLLEKIQ